MEVYGRVVRGLDRCAAAQAATMVADQAGQHSSILVAWRGVS